MTPLLFATNNQHKLREVSDILGEEYPLLSLQDIGLDVEIPENQDTLDGNARQKAWFIFNKTGMNCFSDDTGLEIMALDGCPGVYSARYAGDACSFEDNIEKVLNELEGIENRKACFRTVICLIMDGREHLFEGKIEGEIILERKGKSGFGYDPVFLPEGNHQTFAEMPAYLKNGISHRARAVTRLLQFLKQR